MGLRCSGKILLSPSPSPTRVWEERRETRDERRETRDERPETRDERRETRRETRDETRRERERRESRAQRRKPRAAQKAARSAEAPAGEAASLVTPHSRRAPVPRVILCFVALYVYLVIVSSCDPDSSLASSAARDRRLRSSVGGGIRKRHVIVAT